MSFLDRLNGSGREAVLGKLREAGLREYGYLNEDLAEKISRAVEGHGPADGPLPAAGGLNNHDFSHMLLKVIEDEPEKVLNGLQAVAWLAGAERMYLYLPEKETALAGTVSAKAEELGLDVEVVNGIVNARLMRDGITCHVETLKAVAEVLEGTYRPETLAGVVRYEDSEKETEVKAPAYVPFGTRLTELTGSLEGIKAVGVGTALYTPAEAEGVVLEAGTALGDGVVRLYGEGCCMVRVTEKGLLRSRRESCGKCTFCREGLLQLHVRMHEITGGKGNPAGLDIMKEIGETMGFSCNCTLGNLGSSLALETMRKFGNEYEDHISKKKCTAGSCLAFVSMYIDPKKCTGCGECIRACGEEFIEGLPGFIHMIEDLDCTKCGRCMEACPEDAIVRTLGNVPGLPDRLTRVGRFKRY